MDQKNIPNNEYNVFTFELRKFVSDFSKKNNLEENDFFDDELLSFDGFPKKTSLQLVFLILLYKKEVTESRLRSFSGQYAGITKSLRDRGFLFKGDTNSKNSKFRFKNSKGEFCRKIEGYKKTLKRTKKLNNRTLNLLEKAKESALLAVDVYNKPRTAFRSGGFIVLMCIAWVSLLHAIFEKDKKDYYHKISKKSGKSKMIDGDKKAWGLADCIENFFDINNPIGKNIQFFIGLRNKIEHRFMPVLDPEIVGECQAFILNFEELLVSRFGKEHSLIECLFIPLQLSESIRTIPKTSQEKKVLEFINTFRSSLSTDIECSQKYAFKAFFVPKLGNHRNSSDVAIEFIKFDEASKEDMAAYEKMIIGIKERQVPVANLGKYRPSKILKKIEEKTGKVLTIQWHTSMWKKHNVRPDVKQPNKTKTDVRYCQFDVASPQQDYIYTDDWIDFLIENEIKK